MVQWCLTASRAGRWTGDLGGCNHNDFFEDLELVKGIKHIGDHDFDQELDQFADSRELECNKQRD